MTSVTMQWYALYLRSRYEKKVYEDLGKKNVEAFLPLIEEVRIWTDRKKKIQEPLFRGYIFVKTDLRDKEMILITDGVVRFVGINHKPSSIPESQIEWLRRVIGESKEVQHEEFLKVGERVKIIAGPFWTIIKNRPDQLPVDEICRFVQRVTRAKIIGSTCSIIHIPYPDDGRIGEIARYYRVMVNSNCPFFLRGKSIEIKLTPIYKHIFTRYNR